MSWKIKLHLWPTKHRIPTFYQGALHARNGRVNLRRVLVLPNVFQQQFGVRQALYDGIHETRVADVLQTVQPHLFDARSRQVPSIIVTISPVAIQRVAVPQDVVRGYVVCRQAVRGTRLWQYISVESGRGCDILETGENAFFKNCHCHEIVPSWCNTKNNGRNSDCGAWRCRWSPTRIRKPRMTAGSTRKIEWLNRMLWSTFSKGKLPDLFLNVFLSIQSQMCYMITMLQPKSDNAENCFWARSKLDCCVTVCVVWLYYS